MNSNHKFTGRLVNRNAYGNRLHDYADLRRVLHRCREYLDVLPDRPLPQVVRRPPPQAVGCRHQAIQRPRPQAVRRRPPSPRR